MTDWVSPYCGMELSCPEPDTLSDEIDLQEQDVLLEISLCGHIHEGVTYAPHFTNRLPGKSLDYIDRRLQID